MISQTIARRYAKALLVLGQEDGNFDKYGQEVAGFVRSAAASELTEALTNPIYPAASRRQLLDAVLNKMDLSKITQNFLKLLMDKGRINHIEAISDHYSRLVDEINNIKRAKIITASDLPEATREQVKKSLEELTSKTILLEIEQDKDIIGGIVAQVGDLTLDGSVKTQLANLKESLIKG